MLSLGFVWPKNLLVSDLAENRTVDFWTRCEHIFTSDMMFYNALLKSYCIKKVFFKGSHSNKI
jgi:hypothetical protein